MSQSRAFAVFVGLLTALSAGLWGSPAHGQSIGISPPELVVEDGFRGSEYTETFGIINERAEPITFRLTVKGPRFGKGTPPSVGDASAWITLLNLTGDPPARIEAQPNATTPVSARIRVPDDAANGTYRADINIQQMAGDDLGGGSGQNITGGFVAQVRVDVVGTQRLEAAISNVVLGETEVGQPLRIRMALENTGNVELVPQVRLSITDGQGNPVDPVAQVYDPVPVGDAVSLTTEWDTTGRLPGAYRVGVAVLLTGEQRYNKQFPFQLFPEGTFTRQGDFLSLELTNRPDPGAVASLIADFQNTGKIDSLAKFVGRVFRGGELVDTVESTELLVQAGARGELEVFVPVEERGAYSIEGLVNFEGHETDTRTIEFKVPANLGGGGFLQTWQIIAIGAIAVLIVAAGALEVRRRMRRKPSEAAG